VRLAIDGLRLGTGQNAREHWRTAALRKKREKEAAWIHLRSKFGLTAPPLPLVVTIIRVSPGNTPLDGDNVETACKYVRDEIARWIGVDDGDPGFTWRCAQARGPWGVVIEVERGVALSH
jgi:hypothetical protein